MNRQGCVRDHARTLGALPEYDDDDDRALAQAWADDDAAAPDRQRASAAMAARRALAAVVAAEPRDGEGRGGGDTGSGAASARALEARRRRALYARAWKRCAFTKRAFNLVRTASGRLGVQYGTAAIRSYLNEVLGECRRAAQGSSP